MAVGLPMGDGSVGQNLSNKVAVVTGSSQGIGLAVAYELASRGARVALNGRHEAKLQQQVDALSQCQGTSVLGIAGDVSLPVDMEHLAARVAEEWGGIDIWVNNAGDTVVEDSLTLPAEQFARVVSINLNGAFYGSQAAARVMAERGGGVIVQMGSIYGEVGAPRRAAYVSSKHALVGLTKVLADEWASLGIRVLCLEPGYIQTELALPNVGTGDDYTVQDIEGRTPMGRYGTPSEVARVLAFLASEEASFMTGNTVRVDGGWLAHGGWRGGGGS